MISQKYIKELFGYIDQPKKDATTEDLFKYIVESEVLGNKSQVREFIKKLSIKQHNEFLIYLQATNINLKEIYLK